MSLEQFGWDAERSRQFEEYNPDHDYHAARVVYAQRGLYRVVCENGELRAQVSGRFRYLAGGAADYPATGDWVCIRTDPRSTPGEAVIHSILPRRTWLSRKAAGQRVEEQLICANVDCVVLVSGLDRDFNLRRIERYLSVIYEGGAQPLIVLNKVDLCDDLETKMAELKEVTFDLPVICTNAVSGEGLEALDPYLQPGTTAAFVGSSGVGKSTLINRLLGHHVQATANLRSDGKGRHTTTERELFLIPGKGMAVDNPGMRELQLWAHEDSVGDTFSEIEQLAERCRFPDCRHDQEPGCAVLEAVEAGTLEPERLGSFLKQRRELERLARSHSLSSQDRYNLRRREGRQWQREIRNRFKDRY